MRNPCKSPALACALTLLATALSGAVPAHAAADDPVIAPEVLASFDARATTDFWVRMSGKADLAPAKKIAGRTARGRDVVERLHARADRDQEPLRKLLKAEGVKSTAFWVTNAVYVKNASQALAKKIAKLPGVEEIRTPVTYTIPEPIRSTPAGAAAATGLTWGVSDINADDVWARTGRRGEDIVIANIDSGVQYDHPALVKSYRGTNADGTFTHDYNWYDPLRECPSDAPCDNNSHGTHTMGTMAGDDGQGNQIGVAPGVRWIAAKGCTTDQCSEEALVASSQWMLAPTDSTGADPDASKRPHIVNNSWGASLTTQPFMEDIQLAWAASGIMGIWSNGNDGPGCQTSGSPGGRVINYSVGAYDVDNKIASFSSRGPGQDGEIKPNISAPGVNVRSSVPGGAYAFYNGTSMAAPHVAGAVALLWSARPEYVRDTAATRLLLDLSAIDTDDTSCGGTAADNAVYGEGRLDALALVEAGTRGTATLSGTVTDATTGRPVEGATVTLTGPLTRTSTLGADGDYRYTLVAGEYQLKAEAFGYRTTTKTATLARDDTLTLDVALPQTERIDLTGTVSDGSGLGRGLAAQITADDGKGHTWNAESDPGTGAYTLSLLPSMTYTLTTRATEPGYDPSVQQVTMGETGRRLDLGLTVSLSCVARGYEVIRDGSTEPFDAATAPKGWTVTNVDPRIPNYAYQPGWVFTDAGGRGNHTGGAGGFAIVDSLHSGKGHLQDTYLTSPSYDLTDRASATLEFAHDLKPAVNSTTGVDLSVDGGRTWKTVWSAKGFPGAPGPAVHVVPLPAAAGQADVRIRLHYRGQLSGWWAVDDLFVGDRTCRPAAP
ncbi:S8 family serine peptidase [Nonomuraea fuscirosea]|uniref:S8 family serine peptidase n=1 Tax=Nonomuraea fuscirosea TaxID=1291556 RepID=UPI002DD83B78|nr:S8 family serine peptidase [Nonomuraea fuscirosea]WSA55958.1 S8 family serine peptidase [Nonomuraea fuscirosea]